MTPDRQAPRFFGHGLPYTDIQDLGGALITIEGTDGVGRSTQVRLLKEWLEVQGYGVVETGWTRSELMSETIGAAKAVKGAASSGASVATSTAEAAAASSPADRPTPTKRPPSGNRPAKAPSRSEAAPSPPPKHPAPTKGATGGN